MTNPRLSVVMATYNRADTLVETLAHLDAQDLPAEDFEVVLVDDGSSDHTAAVAAAAAERVRFRLTYLSHPNRGPGYTENRGILAAKAPVCMLMADDIFLSPQALSAHLAVHHEHPEQEVAALGQVLQSPTLNQSLFLRTWDPFRFRYLGDRAELPYYYFWACNVSFKTDFMRRHGMFREEMGRAGAAAHEDVELGYRLHQHGLRIIYSRAALGYHHHIETLDGAMRRAYQRGLNWGEFHERVPVPEITVRYHVCSWATLADHWHALSGPRRQYLLGPDRSAVLLGLRYLLRGLLFNRALVGGLWVPLLAAAEKSSRLARLVNPNLYRGVISHRFFRGCADASRLFPDSQAKGKQAAGA
jgi:GT2 family glycosyltransferase